MRLQCAIFCLIATTLAGCSQTRLEGSVSLDASSQPDRRSVSLSESAPERIRAELIDMGSSGVFFEVARREGVVTWRAPDESAIITEDGLLKSTFGLGFDLVSADVADISPLILNGENGTGIRVHRYLDGENQIVPRAFRCEIRTSETAAGRSRLIETCFGADLSFENDYVLAADGGILTSRQWVGPQVGLIRITRLGTSLGQTVVVVAGN